MNEKDFFYRLPSETRSGKSHQCRITLPSRELFCTCEDYKFNSPRTLVYRCKHISNHLLPAMRAGLVGGSAQNPTQIGAENV